MSAPAEDPLAFRVADRLRSEGPWEVFAERLHRFEAHYNGRELEVLRGPLTVEGYGVRVFRTRGEVTGTGFQASTDSSSPGVSQSVRDAEEVAARSSFPTRHVDLPIGGPTRGAPDVLDTALWDAPEERLQEYMSALLAPFDALHDVVPSFGSLRATLAETSVANSAGLRAHYSHTTVGLELALKAFGGPEGRSPGEYWLNDEVRRLDPTHAGEQVPQWAQFARDARVAESPPTGDLAVVLPPDVLSGILPSVLGYRFSGLARLRKISPAEGSMVAAPGVSLYDDGTIPWAPGSAPLDDEGTPTGRLALVEKGATSQLLYDLLHAGAFDLPATGNGFRGGAVVGRDWLRFSHDIGLGPTTIALPAGDAGSDTELVETAGDGIWLQQLGWAVPDALSGAFGGEMRIGYRIRNGKLAEPLRGGTVGGVVMAPPGEPSLLANIRAVGSRPVLAEGYHGPSVLVRSLSVAGA